MSSGTSIIESALQRISAHSVATPAQPESIMLGMERLNSMIQDWESRGIILGCVPLSAPGDELSEPYDAKNGIIDNLAIEVSPDFDSGKPIVSNQLSINARRGYAFIERQNRVLTIPDKVPSSTLPRGAGNSREVGRKVFAGSGAKING